MASIFKRFLTNPISTTKLAFTKIFITPGKYKTEDGYKADKYWEDRLVQYGESLKGVGREGANEQENQERYELAEKIFIQKCKSEIGDIKDLSILEVGTGIGLITNMLKKLGAVNYKGVDITDKMFDKLKNKFPGFVYQKADVTKDLITTKHDLIVIIDVILHIVTQENFDNAMQNLKQALKPGGKIIIAPIDEIAKKQMFHIHKWSMNDIKRTFDNHEFGELTEWVEGKGIYITTIKCK